MLTHLRPAVLRPAVTLVAAFILLLGLAYPLAMTGAAQILFPAQANGSLVAGADGAPVGSRLIGQRFAGARYLHPRPSVTEPPYNAASSGGSNLGPSSAALRAAVAARAQAFGPLPVPSDAATASASGLDPHVSLATARAQVARIAAARGLAPAAVEAALARATTRPAFGFVGGPIVNVLEANLALDGVTR